MNKESSLSIGWKTLKFSECVEQINTGLNPRKNFSLGSGNIKYITAKNLNKFGTIDFEKCAFIDENAKNIIRKRSDLRIGDILFSSRAPVGHCHLIKDEPSFYDIGESIFSIRVNQNIVRPDYFCLYLASDFFVELATRNVTGSIIQEIRIGDLMNIEVIVPPKEIQEIIANSISKIDKKIVLNKSICSDLESIEKLIYDYWFVQFDFPDENGNPYKSSGGKMVWNEELKREIPEGWTSWSLADHMTSTRGVSYSTPDLSGDGVPMLNLANFSPDDTYNVVGIKNYSGTYSADKVLKPYELIMCNTQQTALDPKKDIIGHCLLVPDIFESDVVSSHHVNHLAFDKKNLNYLVYGESKTVWFHKYMAGLSSGTNILGMDFSGVYKYKMVMPKDSVLERYAALIKQLEARKNIIITENQQLTSLRDFLLPMLMNGQVKVGKEGT